MLPRSRIVWKLSSVFIVVLLLVITVTVFLNNRADEHYALRSARDLARLTSKTILESMRDRMMAGDNDSIRTMVDDIAGGSSAYADLRLIAHHGKVLASPIDRERADVSERSRACRLCHDLPVVSDRLAVAVHDEIVERASGERLVSVITPVFNEPGCRNAACHEHLAASAVLGLLQVDFSLADVDGLIAFRNVQTAVFALVAICLTVALVWLLTNRLLDRPIGKLKEGMKKLGEEDFSYRFEVEGDDEFSALGAAFNSMAEKLEHTLTELRDTRDYLEGIVESSADIIITVNPRGYVYTFNRGAEDALGFSRGEMIGRNVESLFADPNARAEAGKRLRTADNVLNFETRLVTKGGGVRDVVLTLTRLRDPQGNTIGTFGIGKDVTESNLMRKQLLQTERFAAIGQALAGLQHALKNMLNALKGGAYMVKVGLARDKRGLLEEGWAMVQQGIENLTSMSAHMLGYIKEWKPTFADVDIGEMIRKIEGVFGATAADKGVRVSVDVDAGAPLVRCDERLVHSAVMDILSNALDACKEKEYAGGEQPEIKIRAHSDDAGSVFVLAVRDNGCGMSEEVMANVFTPLFSTKKSWGTGLGMALTARTIRMHGGEIEVESQVNVGSEFRIIVPAGGPTSDKEEHDGQESAGR